MKDSTTGNICQSFLEISLTGSRGAGRSVKVSPEDYERFRAHKWYLVGPAGYAARIEGRASDRRIIYMHREVLSTPSGFVVDHVNGDRLDNRRENLRPASRSQNNYNQRRDKDGQASRYKGVTWNKRRQKWIAQINHNGRHVVIGSFDSEDAAARARDGAALALHGDFASLCAPHLEPLPYKPPVPMVKTSSLPGVGWSKAKGKWRAFTTVSGKMKHLGYFGSEEKAYEAYLEFRGR